MSTAAVYDERYQGDYRGHLEGYEIARWDALKHLIANKDGLASAHRVLDYGAGSGLHVKLWEQSFPESELHFCDISSVARQKFSEKYSRHSGRYFLIGDPEAANKKATFDVVVSIEVMEHVEDLDGYLNDVYSLLKPGGSFLWTTPCGNAGSIEHIYCAVTRTLDATPEGYRRWTWEDPTHVRRLKTREIKALLLAKGFAEVSFKWRSHLFSFVCTYLPTTRLAALRNRLMTLDYKLFRNLPNGASMIGVARKAES